MSAPPRPRATAPGLRWTLRPAFAPERRSGPPLRSARLFRFAEHAPLTRHLRTRNAPCCSPPPIREPSAASRSAALSTLTLLPVRPPHRRLANTTARRSVDLRFLWDGP